MAEAILNPTAELSESEYKKLCKQIRAHQLAKQGTKRKSLPLLAPLGEVSSVQRELKIQKSPVEFSFLSTGTVFSLDSMGTVLYAKSGKVRALNLNSNQSISVGNASCYRVFL